MAGRSGRIGNETGRNVSAREKRGFGVELMGLTLRRFLCVLLSAALLAAGWLGLSGLPLVVALVPLLWISRSYGSSRRDWWGMFGWAWLAFALWNLSLIHI